MATIKSIEEKAKTYDEALKAAVVVHKDEDRHLKATLERIFPELKESEDERIRKDIISYLKSSTATSPKTWIAWLEKQGEQKPQGKTALEAINEEKVDNANKVEPRQEKLTEFERAVKQVMEEAIECGDTHNLKADAEMLLNLIQKPDEEYNITGIHSKHAEGKLGEMIKNLKPAWSEEEQQIIEDAACVILDCVNTAETEKEKKRLEELFDKLQDLKPQPTWKPSDEQIKAVKEAACYSSVFSEKTIDNLISLSKDLKKLKG